MPRRLGIGAQASSTPRSLRIKNSYPSLIANDASRHNSSTAAPKPSAPSATRNNMRSVLLLKCGSEIPRIFCRSALVKIGCWTLIRRQDSGDSSIKLGFGPMFVTSDITSCSRIGSIGGLVTCANSCLKYLNKSCGRSDNTAKGVSVPMEEIGSSPLTIMGVMTILSSSTV